jgi:hypothetical protein
MRFSYLGFLLFFSGCAYRTPPVHAPSAIEIDEVTASDPEAEADVRRDAERLLARAGRGAAGEPARVRVHVQLEERYSWAEEALRQDGFALFGLWPALLGMKTERQDVAVDVTLETRAGTFWGHGTASKEGGLFAPARRRALAVALDRALADASAQNASAALGGAAGARGDVR